MLKTFFSEKFHKSYKKLTKQEQNLFALFRNKELNIPKIDRGALQMSTPISSG